MKKVQWLFVAAVSVVGLRANGAEVFADRCYAPIATIEVGSEGTVRAVTTKDEKFEIGAKDLEKNPTLLPLLLSSKATQTKVCVGFQNEKVTSVKVTDEKVKTEFQLPAPTVDKNREPGRPVDK